MSKFLVTLITAISLFAMVTPDADARRMGGSRSFGKQSSNVTTQKAPAQPTTSGANQASSTAPAAAPGAAGAAAAAKPASPWKGMLGGALLGLGLGALLSSLGLGAGMANFISILLMAGIAFVVVRLLMRLFRQKSAAPSSLKTVYAGQSDSSAMQYSATQSATPEIGSRLAQANRNETDGCKVDGATWEIPADFDVPQFERVAQTHFIRMQAAWDRADINDIREFTTPEMYAEIKLQLQERGEAPSVTEVMTINAKLLGVETQESNYLASVRFVGTIREDDGPTVSFDEVWNLSKPIAGSGGWLLAGIQQAE